jgi:hypothetical protein
MQGERALQTKSVFMGEQEEELANTSFDLLRRLGITACSWQRGIALLLGVGLQLAADHLGLHFLVAKVDVSKPTQDTGSAVDETPTADAKVDATKTIQSSSDSAAEENSTVDAKAERINNLSMLGLQQKSVVAKVAAVLLDSSDDIVEVDATRNKSSNRAIEETPTVEEKAEPINNLSTLGLQQKSVVAKVVAVPLDSSDDSVEVYATGTTQSASGSAVEETPTVDSKAERINNLSMLGLQQKSVVAKVAAVPLDSSDDIIEVGEHNGDISTDDHCRLQRGFSVQRRAKLAALGTDTQEAQLSGKRATASITTAAASNEVLQQSSILNDANQGASVLGLQRRVSVRKVSHGTGDPALHRSNGDDVSISALGLQRHDSLGRSPLVKAAGTNEGDSLQQRDGKYDNVSPKSNQSHLNTIWSVGLLAWVGFIQAPTMYWLRSRRLNACVSEPEPEPMLPLSTMQPLNSVLNIFGHLHWSILLECGVGLATIIGIISSIRRLMPLSSLRHTWLA